MTGPNRRRYPAACRGVVHLGLIVIVQLEILFRNNISSIVRLSYDVIQENPEGCIRETGRGTRGRGPRTRPGSGLRSHGTPATAGRRSEFTSSYCFVLTV
jgi:hypothetical protein